MIRDDEEEYEEEKEEDDDDDDDDKEEVEEGEEEDGREERSFNEDRSIFDLRYLQPFTTSVWSIVSILPAVPKGLYVVIFSLLLSFILLLLFIASIFLSL